MNPRDPNLAQLELIAQVLGSLREELVFGGGCAVGLLMSDPAASPARVTYEVDLVVEVALLPECMNEVAKRLRRIASLNGG